MTDYTKNTEKKIPVKLNLVETQINGFTESHFVEFPCPVCKNKIRVPRDKCIIHRDFTLTVNTFLRCSKCDLFFAIEKSIVVISVLNDGRMFKSD
jgi:uncharacterized protein YbaR (Trm112 family)